MKNKLYFILQSYIKNRRSNNIVANKSGFTLIELLVAMILAVLVITPLLGFMINILDTDRKEQAKVNSEQEIQTALDYIAQDLKQAIYIYDAKGIKAIKNKLPYRSSADRTPVLVFWKRQFEKEAIDVKVGGSSKGANDSFVYSLVTYYLIQSNTNNNKDKTWSKQFRIARFELKGGIRNLEKPYKSTSGSITDPNNFNYIKGKEPDPGFALFQVNDPRIKGTLEEKMNSWKKYNNDLRYDLSKTAVLVDYVDASPVSDLRSRKKYKELEPIDCTTVFDLDNIPSEKRASKKVALQVPSFTGIHSYATNKSLNNGSFYACVDIDRVSAKVFIRGNAYARINDRDTNYQKSVQNTRYNQNRQSYFPTASSQVKARGLIGALKN